MASTFVGSSGILLRAFRPSVSSLHSSITPISTHTFTSSSSASSSTSSGSSGGSSRKSKRNAAKPPKGPKNTPPGTNAKPPASGRPKRYDTTYGIPPLRPEMYLKGAEKLNREIEERAQQPDYEKLWRLQDEISAGTNEREISNKTKELEELRVKQPRRHPLWAFFHERTRAGAEDAEKYMTFKTDSEGKELAPPGYFSLGFSLDKPDRAASTSGRAWDAVELRRKSFDDLHKLWYILTLERNVLYSQKEEARRMNVDLMSYSYVSEQLLRCRKSMARIKYILNERRRAALQAQDLIKEAQRSPVGESSSSDASQTHEASVRRGSSFMEPDVSQGQSQPQV